MEAQIKANWTSRKAVKDRERKNDRYQLTYRSCKILEHPIWAVTKFPVCTVLAIVQTKITKTKVKNSWQIT